MTVVRVLRDPVKVAAPTRARVEQVIRETGYMPDLMARGLASQRSELIGAVIPVLTNSLIAEIMQGLSDTLVLQGYHLLLGASGFSAAEEEVLVRAFLSRRVEAIYLSGVEHSAATVQMLRRAAIPVYASIGYVGAYPKDNDRARDRRQGYERALRAARRAVDTSLCVETTLDIDAGARAMSTLLDRRPDVRAVFCSADALAVGALFECQRRRLAIPADVAIAGFDDIPIAAQVVPALTTIRVPRYDIGLRAGKMLCDRLAKRSVRRRIVDTGFELVSRDSA